MIKPFEPSLDELISERKRMTEMLSLYLGWAHEAKVRIEHIDTCIRQKKDSQQAE